MGENHDLGLRSWSKPRTITQWVGYVRQVLSMKLHMEGGRHRQEQPLIL